MISTLNTEVEIDYRDEILKLKKGSNAVILAHYYQESEIQDLADFVGDSLELARRAKSTNADIIVFAGVHFMAETAKILSPHKPVLLPDLEAGCSLADSCPAPLFKAFREKHPDHVAITYINCTAAVKALSDIICTSSNAEKIINQIPKDQPILFAPDRNLGKYLIKKTGRDMLLWDGTCIVHETFSERKIIDLQTEYPDAKLIAHPECEDALLNRADYIGSTSKLLQFTKEDSSLSYIVATEVGIIHQMKKASPHKNFIPAPPEKNNCNCNECPYMKLNTLEKLYLCMKNGKPEITMDKEILLKALKPIERMLEMS
ncbi:MAG: quinolinate synthase [Ignavibacteria bacterium RIFOXYB2_FULL_35_12]|nr:MAG: quinolinate synthase [Ignavibacteria bacterium GWA2_36_19]OGU55155.1 MAG: quinolinate synthase [Ignavibacteria bacterium GWC2_35_8]OGU58607.1 MAG: quinolinate synthase [Ignavibacteria bacterium GWF2_35_20]OGU81159.1 MAG: quinolinate synthase [Ignavibacteria bacterium RIFOXYA2_FULL_35_9]OGU87084.1 MAG: quinolinate synthase [Ignavibacteria bacterium RIFOXYA12_FULL_35_25]OGU92399.1 MAG: quinolinate synthase [Ignavibacteria bacterium RIFOXYC12_FULL_35_11]OGU95776.1 MAG: quinolinate syntha